MHRRALPWRDAPTPYRVWISEIMLQQTQVKTVLPYFERWMRRFPRLEALAAAPEAEVLAAWEGLGYYRRARLLHRAARQLVDASAIPGTMQALVRLPGMGRYTAAAVASIAFNQPVAVVDGNVRRVLARVHGLPEPSEKELWERAEHLLDRERPGDFNQAVMELGATVCTPRAPRCPICPWQGNCRAATTGDPERFSAPKARPCTVHVRQSAAALLRRGRLLLARSVDKERYQGLWELPRTESADAAGLAAWLHETLGLVVRLEASPITVRYSITHHRVLLSVCRGRVVSGRARRGPYTEVRWFGAAELPALPMSAPMRRAIKAVDKAMDAIDD